MKTLLFLFSILAVTSIARAADKKEEELAARYDYVGVVTHARIASWNVTRDRKLSAVDPKKVPKGRILVGIIADPNDPDFPLKGRIYEEGIIYDTKWDVSMKKEVGGLWVGWESDEGTDIVKIAILRKGAGFRREK